MPLQGSEEPIRVLFDSGAYTAWRSGNTIDLKAYCRFLKINEDWITDYAVLDKINPGDPNDAAQQSWANFKAMRAEGLNPIPIYHVGEHISWLHRMIDEGADYIGLSASSITTRGNVDGWYALMWEHLCSQAGMPTIRTHAFGEGRMASLLGGPWTSADTATWVYSSMRAGVVRIGGQRLSHRKDGVTFRHAADATKLDEINKSTFESLLARIGLLPDALHRVTKANEGLLVRAYMAAHHYKDMQDTVRRQQPIKYRPHGFHAVRSNLKEIESKPFNFYLVCNENAHALVPALMAGVRNILLSYAYINNNTSANTTRLRRLRHLLTSNPLQFDEKPYFELHRILSTFLEGQKHNA